MISVRAFRRYSVRRRQCIIAGIEDPFTREIMTVAFVSHRRHSWAYVATHIGGDNTPDSVRKIATRALARLAPCPFSGGES